MRRAALLPSLATALVFAATATACSSPEPGAAPTPSPQSTAPSSSAPSTSGGAGTPTASASSTSSAPGTATRPPTGPPRVAGVVSRDLEAPWSVAFLPDGSALVSERDRGRIVQVPAGGGDGRPVGEVPGVDAEGEGGLLGLAVSPTFATDGLVYAYLTASDDNRVVRMRLDGSRLGPADVVLSGIAKAGIHNGGRIAFGPDDFLYVATGDAAESGAAQDRSSLSGKILRVTAEGRPAPGNPFPDSPVWSYGHRNVQGIAWDSRGRMWASEFGQNTYDELNRIEPGRNYGWPEVEGPEEREGLTAPQVSWTTEESSPSGIAVVGDVVYVAGLRGARLWRVPVDGERAGKAQDFFTGEYGRLRSVTAAPDGSLWLGTSNRDGRGDPRDGDDKILRVTFG